MSKSTLAYIPLVLWSLVILFPIYWMASTAFKRPIDVFQGAAYLPWVDFEPTLDSWRGMLSGDVRVVRPFVNSLIAASLSSVLAVVVGAMAAFGLSRFNYRFGPWRNREIAFWFISQRMLPPAAVILAFFVMFNYVGLLDSVWALTIAYLGFNLPLAIWLLRDFFESIPRELEESALIEGASWWGAFLRVTLPLAVPGLAATLIFLFIFSWNEYFFASLLAFTEARTLPVTIAEQATSIGVRWWTMSVLITVAMLPTVLLAFMVERFIVRGLTTGGVK